jgi:hypothetical protein
MRSTPIEPLDREIEFLLANERTIEPEPDDFRMRVVERARAELAHHIRNEFPDWHRFSKTRRATVAFAVAAGVMLVAMCAVAFRPLYQRVFGDQVPTARTSRPEARSASSQIPSVAPAIVPEVPTTPTEVPLKAKAAGRTRTAKASETYAIEFALLRPAYQAVARHDFPSALTAIAAHHRRFASGQLAEEREALRVKALLGLGRRAEAQQAASAFRERFPRSVLLRRIESMLDVAP